MIPLVKTLAYGILLHGSPVMKCFPATHKTVSLQKFASTVGFDCPQCAVLPCGHGLGLDWLLRIGIALHLHLHLQCIAWHGMAWHGMAWHARIPVV